MNGWAIFLADVVVMVSLSDIAAEYTFKLFGFTELGESKAAIIVAAVLWIMLMTWICYRGIELSARLQSALLGVEVAILIIFSVVALVKVYGGSVHPLHAEVESHKVVYHSIKPTLDWFNPFAMKFSDLFVALLIGFFIYWGWDSGVAVNEESRDPAEGPGKAAVVSTILLVVIYVIVTAAAQSFHGTKFLGDNESDVLNALGKEVLGGTLNKLLIITVLTSASASTQTTILPTARTTLSMAHWKAVTSLLARVHKRFLTPTVSTIGFGALSIVFTVVILLLSESVLLDSISAVGFPICFYYGFTGIACAVYYRKELTKSIRNFLVLGAGPMIGGLAMFGVFYKAAVYYGHQENVASKEILGITLPLWMGVGGMFLGFIIMLFSRPSLQRVLLAQARSGPARNPRSPDRGDSGARRLLTEYGPSLTRPTRSRDPPYARDLVEPAVERQDLCYAPPAHDGSMDGVTRRQLPVGVHQVLRSDPSAHSTANTSSTIARRASKAGSIASRRPPAA